MPEEDDITSKDVGGSIDDSVRIMVRLKVDTQAVHTRLESLPYFKTLMAHQLPLECYVNQLRALSIIHGVLEKEISDSENQWISSVWDDDLRKLTLLEEDLAFFKPRVILDTNTSIEAALSMTEKIRLRCIEKPETLLGYLYVFEGSTLGNRMHQTDIVKTFHLDGSSGCRYYSSYQDQVQPHWNQFSEKMNAALTDSLLHDAIIKAAHEAFSGLETLYKALYPLKKSKPSIHIHVTRINPEAGNHPIPSDEREIQAALQASDRGWREFPYYEQRYGDRGKRFSDSDTCWLVTLTELDMDALQKQIEWICRVLATRGMPTLMMEQTLRFLHEALIESVRDQTGRYDKLLESAERIKEVRERIIPEHEFETLSDDFEQSIGSHLAEQYKNIGKLLVSSVADEKNGMDGAVSAISDWMTDGTRFTNHWISTVNDVISKATAAATKPDGGSGSKGSEEQ